MAGLTVTDTLTSIVGATQLGGLQTAAAGQVAAFGVGAAEGGVTIQLAQAEVRASAAGWEQPPAHELFAYTAMGLLPCLEASSQPAACTLPASLLPACGPALAAALGLSSWRLLPLCCSRA